MNTDRKTTLEENGSVVADILRDIQELFGQQLAMFRAEIQEDLQRTKQAAFTMALGVALGLVGGGLVAFMLIHLLHWAVPDLPLWAAHGLVALALLVTGGGLFLSGQKRLTSFNPLPNRSVQAAKENLEWLTQPK